MKKKEEVVDANWYLFQSDVYRATVFLFLGTREDMCRTAADALCGEKLKLKIEDAKCIAKRLDESFGKSVEGMNGECLSLRDESGTRIWIVRLDDFDASVDSTVVLSHECLHAALSILGECGVSENPPFEALCYMHEAIFHRFMLDAFGHVGMLKHQEKEAK